MAIFQITVDKHPTDNHSYSFGDCVIWQEWAELAQDEKGKWWDEKCKDRGEVIDYNIVRMLVMRDNDFPKAGDKFVINVERVTK